LTIYLVLLGNTMPLWYPQIRWFIEVHCHIPQNGNVDRIP
jgi:hypothetical protein